MRAWAIATALLVSIPSVLLYISWAVYGKRLLTPGEFLHFAGITAFATVAHIDTNGGPRSWAIIGESLSDTPSQISLEFDGRNYQIPLPPHTIRQSCQRIIAGLPKGFASERIPKSCIAGAEFPTESHDFITAASRTEMLRYLNTTLPAAGWESQDRLGSAWFFHSGEVRVMIISSSYLTTQLGALSLNLMPIPTILREQSGS